MKKNGVTLRFAEESLKKNYDVVLAAETQNGEALQYADESLNKNYEIVPAAVTQNGHALRYADESLKKNYDIVLAVGGTHLYLNSDTVFSELKLAADAVHCEIFKLKDGCYQ